MRACLTTSLSMSRPNALDDLNEGRTDHRVTLPRPPGDWGCHPVPRVSFMPRRTVAIALNKWSWTTKGQGNDGAQNIDADVLGGWADFGPRIETRA